MKLNHGLVIGIINILGISYCLATKGFCLFNLINKLSGIEKISTNNLHTFLFWILMTPSQNNMLKRKLKVLPDILGQALIYHQKYSTNDVKIVCDPITWNVLKFIKFKYSMNHFVKCNCKKFKALPIQSKKIQ